MTEIDGIDRVGDVHEGRSIGQPHDRVFRAVEGIRPAPDIVAAAAADLIQWQEGHQVHVATGIGAGRTARAGGDAHGRQMFIMVMLRGEGPHVVTCVRRHPPLAGHAVVMSVQAGAGREQQHKRCGDGDKNGFQNKMGRMHRMNSLSVWLM